MLGVALWCISLGGGESFEFDEWNWEQVISFLILYLCWWSRNGYPTHRSPKRADEWSWVTQSDTPSDALTSCKPFWEISRSSNLDNIEAMSTLSSSHFHENCGSAEWMCWRHVGEVLRQSLVDTDSSSSSPYSVIILSQLEGQCFRIWIMNGHSYNWCFN